MYYPKNNVTDTIIANVRITISICNPYLVRKHILTLKYNYILSLNASSKTFLIKNFNVDYDHNLVELVFLIHLSMQETSMSL